MIFVKDKDSYLLVDLDPITKATNFIGFEDEVDGENQESYFEKEFRYSLDDVSYSNWLSLTDENIGTIFADPDETFYFEFKYKKIGSASDLIFTDLKLTYETATETKFKTVSQEDCKVVKEVPKYINTATCLTDIFDPSKLDSSYQIAGQLNDWISSQYGHTVKYYKTDANQHSRDVILKEYSLYNISAVEDLNIVVPNNEFPDNAPEFNPMDIDYLEMPWEIHIGTREWCKIFGDDTNPKRKDVLYIPITNRVYEVESAYLFKDFVNRGSYWKLNLIKYQDKANRSFDDSVADTFEQELDEMTRSVDDAFGKEREDDIKRIVKEDQHELISQNNDSTRRGISKSLIINRENLTNNYTLFSKYNYELATASAEYTSPFQAVAVEYNVKPKLQVNKNLAYTLWFNLRSEKINAKKSIDSIVPYQSSQSLITYTDPHEYLTGQIIKVNGINAVDGVYEIKVKSDTEIIVDKKITGSFNELSGVNSEKQEVNRVFDGYDVQNEKGLLIGIIQYGIIIKLNNQTYIFEENIEMDVWQGLVINIGNIFDQISVYIYNRDNEQNRSSKLNLVYSDVKTMAKVEFDVDDYYKVLGGYINITNMRLFSKTIEQEHHSNVLSQYTVKDNHLTYIIDNSVDPQHLAQTPQNN